MTQGHPLDGQPICHIAGPRHRVQDFFPAARHVQVFVTGNQDCVATRTSEITSDHKQVAHLETHLRRVTAAAPIVHSFRSSLARQSRPISARSASALQSSPSRSTLIHSQQGYDTCTRSRPINPHGPSADRCAHSVLSEAGCERLAATRNALHADKFCLVFVLASNVTVSRPPASLSRTVGRSPL